jgi:hypothetical protein
MKTVAEFKRLLSVGVKLHTIHHKTFMGRDEKNNPIYGDKDLGTREVSIVQSNSFALKTTHSDGKVVDSWCSYPKASECSFPDPNTITILDWDTDTTKSKVLTYKFV